MLLPEEHLNEFSNSLPNSDREMDLHHKKHNVTCCSSPVGEKEDDSTCATAFTSMSSLSSYSIRSSLSRSTRSRGSILKSPSSSSSSILKKDPSSATTKSRRTSRISFSTTPHQVFTIENKEEYYDDMFYDQESLADFRYEALMWEAGMVDEDGTPLSLIQANQESTSKYEQVDQANGSLDFDDLLLMDNEDNGNSDGGALKDVEQDKAYSRESIKELRRSIDSSDLQWKANSELFCNLEDWDDDFLDDSSSDNNDESVAGDDELNDDLDTPFTALDATTTSSSGAPLSAKEKFAQQRRQVSFHKSKQQLEGFNFLNQKFSTSFNLKDDDALVFEASDDDGSHQSDNDNEKESVTEEESVTLSHHNHWADELEDEEEQSVTQPRHNLHHWDEDGVGAFACEDDSQQSQRSSVVPCDSDSQSSDIIVGDTSGRSRVRRSLVKRDSLRESLKSLSDVFLGLSTRSLESLESGAGDDQLSDANTTSTEGGGDINNKQGRLIAKMRGLRESLRSIQNLEDDIDSDDDSEWGDEVEDGVVKNSIDLTKNLKRSLIGKHKIYSPVPNSSHPTIEHMMDSVKDMTIPEL